MFHHHKRVWVGKLVIFVSELVTSVSKSAMWISLVAVPTGLAVPP